MVLSSSEKEKAIIELLRQRKKIREIAQQLHISSRDVCNIKKKYEEEQKKNREPNSAIKKGEDKDQISNALLQLEHRNSPLQSVSQVTDDKGDPNRGPIYKDTGGQNNIPEECDNLIEESL